jgi:hypothetical protein
MSLMRRSINLKEERSAFGWGWGRFYFIFLCVCVCVYGMYVIKMKTTNTKIFDCKMPPFSQMLYGYIFVEKMLSL